MALVLADRVQETSTTSGTGTLTLNGAVNGYQSFANGVGNGNTCYYTIYDTVAYTWEVGIGTYTTSGSTLTRTTVLSNSSQTTSLINFAGNLMNVWVDYPAEKAIYQDASGNTYVPSLGGTTPSTGTFTTITGQTANLTGTGQNLIAYSQFQSGWAISNGTISLNSATDPLGTTTAATLTMSGASNLSFYSSTAALTNGTYYTYSIYAKAGTSNTLQITLQSSSSNVYGVSVNLSTQVITLVTGTGTSTITSVGNGWYRIALTGLVNANGTGYFQTYIVGNASTMYLWGAQVNTGLTANTYISTTGTTVYGYPNLSLNSNIAVSMDSSGNLILQPAGTGALQAQQTTSSATGGNARGANAVDWQTASRDLATRVASGTLAVIGGGQYNTASGSGSVVGGGQGNSGTNSGSVVLGGYQNSNSGNQASLVGGYNNTASGSWGAVLGGYLNTAAGFLNFIGGGFTNSGTSGSAVTTQATSTITSGSTAVTLSSSNASIKVGQVVTGTPVASFPATYVAAISGTSLTLSQNATSSTNATLSFYTPHGVVVGGGNNQATGAYSFIGGGGDAGTSANQNIAAADWSVVTGGQKNTITSGNIGSVISGGYSNSITSGTSSSYYYANTIVGGFTNTTSNQWNTVLGGANNNASATIGAVTVGGRYHVANGSLSVAMVGTNAYTRFITGYLAIGVGNAVNNAGQVQAGTLVLTNSTTTTGAVVLTSDLNSASSTNQVVLSNGPSGTVSVYTFRVLISAHNSANTTDIAGWEIKGVISRGNGVGTTALVGTPTVTLLGATSGAISAGWGTLSNVAAVADTTNGALQIQVTGVASTTIRWSARVETNELAY